MASPLFIPTVRRVRDRLLAQDIGLALARDVAGHGAKWC